MKYIHKKYHNLAYSIIGILSILIFSFLSNKFVGSESFYFGEIITIIIVLWVGFSIISKWLEKKFSWNKGISKRLIIEITIVVAYSVLVSILFNLFDRHYLKITISPKDFRTNIIVTCLISFGVVTLSEAHDFFIAWKESLIKSNKLEKDNIEAQFLTLKNQINPHFLFNSLNTLASFVQDNPKANKYIENLSDYLRNSLTLKKDDITTINEELKTLNHYIFLQKARFNTNLELNISIPEESRINSFVPIFCLQMLVENAIKHNIISEQKPLSIDIFVNKNYLTVKNNLQVKETQISTKTGLNNIVDRYKLLTDNPVLINKTVDEFIVSIPLLMQIS